MPVSYPYTQYSGTWTLSQASDAVAQGKWPTVKYLHLLSWGNNTYGQLGLNNTTSYSSPMQVGTYTTWSKISCGGVNTFSIKTDGTLWAWGWNNFGQLGIGSSSPTVYQSSPIQVGSLTNWKQVSAGVTSVAAITTDGALFTWGLNQYGTLGNGNITYYSSPVQVGSLTNWKQVSASQHVMAITFADLA